MANLITIDEYKNYKDINSDNYDTIISALIDAVSNLIKEYTGRSFIDYAYTDKVEYFDATSYPEYYPKEIPIISITSLEYSIDGGVTYTTYVENTDYFVDSEEGIIVSNTTTKYSSFLQTPIGFKSGKLTYTAGYIVAPADLKLAAMDLVEYYRSEEHISRKSMGGASTDNSGSITVNSNLPPHIKRVLDLYRLL